MAWLRRIGLQKKIFIYTGASTLVLMILLSLLFLQTIAQGTDIIRQERLALVKNIALDVDDVIEHLSREIVDTAVVMGQGWQYELTDSHKEQLASWQVRLRQYLVSFHQVEPAVFVAMLDARGKVLWTEPYLAQKVNQSLADTTAVRKVVEKGQVYLETEQALLTGSSPTLSWLAPIKDEQGVVMGMLIADMPTLPSNTGFGVFLQRRQGDYRLELVSESGLVIASSTAGMAFEESFHWEVIHLLAEARLAGVETHYHTPGRDATKAHLVAFVPLAQVAWGVVMVQSQEQVLALPWIMGRRLLMVGGLVMLVGAGLIFIVSRQIVTPLRRLAATAQSFGAGDLDIHIPPMGQDEIGKLAESLDTMRHQLKHSLEEIRQWNQELEQRVKERTNELEELDQQLRHRDKERDNLLGKIITAQEEERRRIARELHDEVSQTLTALVMSLGSAEARLVHDPATKQRLESLRSLTSEAVGEVRRLIQDLRPSLLDDLGLVAAIGWYVANYLAPAGVKTELVTEGLAQRLPPTIEITLFRVVQEAITNIVKHAQAKEAHIRLQLTDAIIVGSIEDDGIGFNMDARRRQRRERMTVGLLGMEERINILAGKLKIESQPGRGTHIHFEIPWMESNGEKDWRSHR